jgi:hypothetical protein
MTERPFPIEPGPPRYPPVPGSGTAALADFGPPPPGFVPLGAAHSTSGRGSGRRVLLVAAAGLAAVAAAVAAAFALGGPSDGVGTVAAPGTAATSPGSHTLALPASVGGLTLLTDGTSRQVGRDMRQQMSAANPAAAAVYAHALVGVYESAGSSKRVIFVGFAAADAPELGPDIASPAAADGVMVGAHVADASPFPAGPLGGAMRCGLMSTGVPICAWADGASLGMVVDGSSRSAAQAAATTRALRGAAEH